MAHKKAGGSTALGRDSQSKRLGIKLQDGQTTKIGSIIVRQRGTKYHAGKNVRVGKDHTLFAMAVGLVKYTNKKMKKFDNTLKTVKVANVVNAK